MENPNGWQTYAAGYKGWGIAKFGITMRCVIQRVKRIGFNVYRDDFVCVAIDGNCENYAGYLAAKKYGQNLWVMDNGIFASPTSPHGFQMRSGHTEVYDCPIEEAEDILKLAMQMKEIDIADMQRKERLIYTTLMEEYKADGLKDGVVPTYDYNRQIVKKIAA